MTYRLSRLECMKVRKEVVSLSVSNAEDFPSSKAPSFASINSRRAGLRVKESGLALEFVGNDPRIL